MLLLAVVGIGGGLAYVGTSRATIATDPVALAKITLPVGGGQIEHLIVARADNQQGVTVRISHGVITPTELVPAGERLTVDATIKRVGWASWSGGSEHLHLVVATPSSTIRAHYVTRRHNQPLRVHFRKPISVLEVGPNAAHLRRTVLSHPQRTVTLPAHGSAGTLAVAGAPRAWEKPQSTFVSWFPGGAGATALASPAPGSKITPHTAITLTLSRPVSKVLGHSMPPVSPTTAGSWHRVNAHVIRFIPTGYGYGLGTQVVVALPASVHLVGGAQVGSDPQGRWTVPSGSTLRLQQLLAQLGYLPVTFSQTGTPVADTMAAQEDAAVNPPQGSFSMRYQNTPAALVNEWQAGTFGELTKGAIMAFENDHGLATDGVAGHDVWKALINAVDAHQVSNFGYTYVSVSEASPETVSVWHSGKVVVTGLVNTGVPAAPTATGTFAVFEHLTVTTMTGTNPDGSHYSDPGIPWVSYFNGGDALHGFIRAGYGYPQSDGCVEMTYAQAARVYPYTPIGTIVNVHS